MESCLFATAFNQFGNCPGASLNACGLRWRHADSSVRFHEIVIREVERHRSLKVFNLFAESVGQPGETVAMHTESVVLLLDVTGGNPVIVGHTIHNRLFNFDDFRRATVEFVNKLEEFARDYVAMLNPSSSKWNEYPPATQASNKTLSDFNVEQIRFLRWLWLTTSTNQKPRKLMPAS